MTDPSRQSNMDADSATESASSQGPGDAETSSSESPEPMEQDENSATNPNNGVPPDVAPPQTPESDRGSHERSEFDSSDSRDNFILWSSDATSPDEDNAQESSPTQKKSLHNWNPTISKKYMRHLRFDGPSGIIGLEPGRKYSPLECFKLFLDDDLINLMVTETNRYARSKFVRYGYHDGFLSGWLDVDFKEMTQFIGLIIFMAIKKMPVTHSYWSTERQFFNPVACRIFTQTRFHRLLSFWHFGIDGTDSPYAKVNPIINRLNENFKKYKEPGNMLYVGKSTVCLRNKYIFDNHRLGTPKKGTKILKCMDQDVYTYKLKLHSPETPNTRISQMKNNVLELLDDFSGKGRLVIFHNLYLSVDLAEALLKRRFHSIGMIRKNARGTPKDEDYKPAEDGEVTGYQNPQGVAVFRWQISESSYFGLSTCHTLETVPLKKSRKKEDETCDTEEEQRISTFLRDFSLSERIFDASEKFSISVSALTDKLKWHQRLVADTIVNVVTTNALILYRKQNKEKIKMWDFRDRLFRELVDVKQLPHLSSDEETEDPDLDE